MKEGWLRKRIVEEVGWLLGEEMKKIGEEEIKKRDYLILFKLSKI